MPLSISRRTLLRGLGTTVALPMFDAMASTRLPIAAEQEVSPPLRMAFLYVPTDAYGGLDAEPRGH